MKNRIEEIKELAYERLESLIGMKGRVEIREVEKNNGQILTGICFVPEGSNCGPTVYAENYNIPAGLDEAIREIAKELKAYVVEGNVDTTKFFTVESLRENLTLRLVNKEKNKQMLESVPYRTVWGDLAEYMVVRVKTFGMPGSIKVTNSLMESGMIGFSLDEMFEIAHENNKQQLNVIKIGPSPMETLTEVTNIEKFNGAGTIVDNLDEFGDDYYIIPSSVHETLVVPPIMPLEDINAMVSEVNRTSVAREDILSDHAYHVVNGEVVVEDMAA